MNEAKLKAKDWPVLYATIATILALQDTMDLPRIPEDQLLDWYAYQLFERRDQLVQLYNTMQYVNTFKN